jgi:hypothetical protein
MRRAACVNGTAVFAPVCCELAAATGGVPF